MGFQTSLFSAAVTGNLEMMEHLHSLYPKKLNDIDEYGCTAFHYSIMHDHLDCIKFLLDNFADYCIRTSSGSTVVDLADGLKAQNLLKEYKITSKSLPSNELFGEEMKKVAVEAAAQDQEEDKDEAAKVTSATQAVHNTMSEAMAGLVKRGEKLKAMENQTTEMKDDAEEFKDMASQLKNQMKKKNKFFGF